MENPEIFREFIDLLEITHKKFPDIRIGQILDNALSSCRVKAQLFYVSNEKLTLCLKKYVENIKEKEF